jgi:zinc transport system substrate-binding protein
MNRSVAALLVGLFSLVPCRVTAQDKPLVVVSVPVLGLVAREIGGPQIDVHQLLQGDASPHDYAMKFSDRKALAQAQRVFWIAPTLEAFLAASLTSNPHAIALFATLPEADAHVWFAPELMRNAAHVMAQHFAQLKPADAAVFDSRVAAFDAQLTKASQKFSARMQALKGIRLIVGHDAYGQLTRANGLLPTLAVLQQVQTAASAQRVAALDQQVNAGGSFCVIEERNHPLPVARQLAQRHGLPLVVIDVYAARSLSYASWLDELGRTLSGCGTPSLGMTSTM